MAGGASETRATSGSFGGRPSTTAKLLFVISRLRRQTRYANSPPATAPPVNDTVTIQQALWQAGILKISATSNNPNAILSVYLTASNSFMFTLTNLGGGRFQMQRPWLDNPLSITVRSNFGGAATHSTVK